MGHDIEVTVKRASQPGARRIVVDADVPVEQLVAGIGMILGWDKPGQPAAYDVEADPPGRMLGPDETLASAGVVEPATLIFHPRGGRAYHVASQEPSSGQHSAFGSGGAEDPGGGGSSGSPTGYSWKRVDRAETGDLDLGGTTRPAWRTVGPGTHCAGRPSASTPGSVGSGGWQGQGSRYVTDAPPTQFTPPQPIVATSAKQAKGGSCLLRFVIAVVLLAVVGIGGFYAYTSYVEAQRAARWQEAVSKAKVALDAAPNFEKHLETYPDLAAELSRNLAGIEVLRPVVSRVNELKRTEVPLVGNAWNGIISAANVVAPGAEDALQNGILAAQRLMSLKKRVDELPRFDDAANAARAFRQSPSRATLLALDSRMDSVERELDSIDDAMRPELDRLVTLVSTGDKVEKSLSVVEDNKIPAIRDAARWINRALGNAEAPVKRLKVAGVALRDRIEEDMKTISAIANATRYGREGESLPLP